MKRKKRTGVNSCFKKFGGDGKGGESKNESVVERRLEVSTVVFLRVGETGYG